MNVENGPADGTGLYTMGPMLGELWVNYADVAADTNGRFQLTAKQKATMSASSYLHVTMEVGVWFPAELPEGNPPQP